MDFDYLSGTRLPSFIKQDSFSDLDRLSYSLTMEKVREDIQKGIYPSFDRIYKYICSACMANAHLIMDSERIVRTIVWEVGTELRDFPQVEYAENINDITFIREFSFFRCLVNLLVNGVECGNEFVKRLVVSLYKSYFSNEYRQYKLFSKVSIDFMLSFVDLKTQDNRSFLRLLKSESDIDDDDDFSDDYGDDGALQLLLAMFVAKADGKEFDDCIYALIDRLNLKAQEKNEKRRKKIILSEKTRKLFLELSIPGTDANRDLNKILDRLLDVLDPLDWKFLDERVQKVYREPWSKDETEELLEKTIRMLRKKGNSEPDEHQIIEQFLYVLMLKGFIQDAQKWNSDIEYLCGRDWEKTSYSEYTGNNRYSSFLFNEDKVRKYKSAISPTAGGNASTPEGNTSTAGGNAPSNRGKNFSSKNENRAAEKNSGDFQKLEKELQHAKDDRRLKQSQLQSVVEKCDEYERRIAELEKENMTLRAEHFELTRMREYIHSLTEEDLPDNDFDNETAVKKLRNKSIVIIGGHENWIGKLKELFPSWNYIGANDFSQKIGKMLMKSDMIYFFTDHLSHKTFNKYMDYIRGNGLKYSYIHTVNIDMNLRQMMKDNVG